MFIFINFKFTYNSANTPKKGMEPRMKIHRPVYIILSILAVLLFVINVPAAGVIRSEYPFPPAPPASTSSGISRDLEPVIITGDKLPLFTGAEITELFGFSYQDGSWKAVPLQIDEVDSDGDYGY